MSQWGVGKWFEDKRGNRYRAVPHVDSKAWEPLAPEQTIDRLMYVAGASADHADAEAFIGQSYGAWLKVP